MSGKVFKGNRPALVIGISGNMDPLLSGDHGQQLRDRLRILLRFLRGNREDGLEQARAEIEKLLGTRRQPASLKSVGLDSWQGIGEETPVVLLSSLAPGVDQIAVEVALEMGIDVRCPLPYPKKIYRDCSTFVRHPEAADNAGDKSRQRGFEEALEALGDKDCEGDEAIGGVCFPVYLDEDLRVKGNELTPLSGDGLAKIHEKMRREVESDAETERHWRYRAAGEYVAAFSDVLIAVCDAEERCADDLTTAPGTQGILEAKRSGVTVGLLPVTNALNWADNGPAFHLHHPRSKKAEPPGVSNRGERCMRVLYPYELNPAPADKSKFAGTRVERMKQQAQKAQLWSQLDERWMDVGGRLFCRYADNLKRFNEDFSNHADADPETEQADAILSKYVGEELATDAWAKRHLRIAEACKRASEALTKGGNWGIMRVRPRSLRDATNLLVCSLVWLAFVSAILLHLFSHWHLEPELGGKYAPHAPAWPQLLAGLIAICLTLAGLVGLLIYKLANIEPRDRDYRALSEGLRIQLYWRLAGLRRSVASNYMQRQRGELDWLRAAISSIGFPHERWQKQFFELPHVMQLRYFTAVRDKWFGGQHKFFTNNADKKRHAVHASHQFGGTLALAGVMHVPILLWLLVGGQDLAHHRQLPPMGIATASLAAIVLLLWIAYHGFYVSRTAAAGDGLALGLRRVILRSFDFWGTLRLLRTHPWPSDGTDHYGHHPAPPPLPSNRNARARVLLGEFFGCSVLALVLAILSFSLVVSVSGLSAHHIPGPFNLGIVMMGTFLVGGALSVAHAEKQMLSENAYQYAAMEQLFRAAGERLDVLLSDLGEVAAAADRKDVAARERFAKLRETVHQLLFSVGTEALDENAEWLILHRSRPIEPVMLG